MKEFVPKSNETKLTDKQKKSLPYFLNAGTIDEACRQSKISKVTYYTWLQMPAFKNELNRLRDEVLEDAIQLLKANTAKAANTLVTLLDNDNPAIQRNVANDILQHVMKFKEIQEIEQRLEALENNSNK